MQERDKTKQTKQTTENNNKNPLELPIMRQCTHSTGYDPEHELDGTKTMSGNGPI